MTCRICGGSQDLNAYNAEQQKALRLCRTCVFWWEKVEWRANGDITCQGKRVARILGNHYVIHPDVQAGPMGFGGRKHLIKFDNGEEVTTHNLWHQGEIPHWFREHLPNNATFIDTRLTCKCRAKFEPITPEQTRCMTCVLDLKPKRW